MKSRDSFKLGLVSAVAVVGIIIMTLLSAYNNNGYYGFATRSKGNIELSPRLSFEAESGTSQGFAIGQDPRASNKRYIYSPNGTGNITYSFEVPQDGLYTLSARIATPTTYAEQGSFYIQLENNEKFLVQTSTSDNYRWSDAPLESSWILEKGKHYITIYATDPNVRIDSVKLSYKGSRCSDNDGDGYGRPANKLCEHPETDCNDRNSKIYPGAEEICGNDVDENCDGIVEKCDRSVNGLFRSFSANPMMSGSTVTVTLTKTLGSGQSTVLVEETVPSGFTVVDSGSGVATGNTIRWAELTGAVSGTYTYTVSAPATPGTYLFSGAYSINGGAESVILGTSSLSVESVATCQNGASQSCTTNLLGICGVGTQTCSNNSWGSCVAPNPQPEICGNGVDEDCNGVAEVCQNVTNFPVNTRVEAESGNNNGFTIANGVTANGYVYTNVDDTNSISYTFNVPQSGQYVIDTRMVNPTSGTDSFFIGLDGNNAQGNNAYVYDSIDGSNVVEDTVRLRGPNGNSTYFQFDPMIFTLSEGTHTFTFYGRERNTKMDYLTLSSYSGVIVCQNGQTRPCTTGLLGVCSAGTQTCSNNSWGSCVQNVQPSIEICGNGVDEDCNGVDLQCAGGIISRSFSSDPAGTNTIVTVTLTKSLQSGQTTLLTEEYIPEGVTVVNSGTGTISGNVIRWAELTGAQSGTYTYTMQTGNSSRNVTFVGMYSVNGGSTLNIVGDTQLSIIQGNIQGKPTSCQNGQTQPCTTGLLGVCSAGTQTCSNNSWGSCVQNVQPSIEICGNGVDEDCSGSDLVCPNTPPIVSISSPVTGSTFNQGDNITVVALASDPNGSIAKVEFYRNNVLVRTDTTFPYSYSWNNAVIGNYTLYARAYDNLNSTSNSASISLLVVPTEYCGNGVCEVTESCGSCSVDCGSCLLALSRGFSSNNVSGNSTVTVTLTKTLQSGQSTLLTEEYVPSGFVISNAGTGTASGNTIRWAELTGAQSGTYTYSVIAPNSAGSYSFSGQYSINGGDSQTIGGATLLNVYAGPRTFVCTSGQTQPCTTGLLGVCSAGTQTCSNNSWGTCVQNSQPLKEICGNGVDEDCNGADLACVNTAPSVNVGIDRSVTLPNTLALSAIVTDDGLPVPPGKTTVMWTKQSGFGTVTFSNQNALNTTATFSTNGTYVLRLTANDSLLTGQDMLTVTVYSQPVNILPTVSIFSPTNGTNYVYPSYIIINSSASDSDGSISKVEFYADGYLRGTDTTYPYLYVWTNASIGTHILTAKAYDNLNASTTSSPVTIGMIQPICQGGQTQSCATGLLGICSAGTATCSNNNWGTCVQNNQPKTEICGNGIDEDCNGVDLACSVSGLSRIFPENIITAGSTFTVTIAKNLQSGQSTLLTEEYVPSGFVISNAGTGTASGNTIRWAELIGAASGTYTYTVRAPNTSGSYIFSGLYSINGGAEASIVGDTQLTVQ